MENVQNHILKLLTLQQSFGILVFQKVDVAISSLSPTGPIRTSVEYNIPRVFGCNGNCRMGRLLILRTNTT